MADSQFLKKGALFGVMFILSISLLTIPIPANAANTYFCAGPGNGQLRLVSGAGQCKKNETEVIMPDVSAMQAQIDSLESQVDTLESELNTANNTISDLQTTLTLLESTVAGLDLAAVEDRVGALETILACVSYDPIDQIFSFTDCNVAFVDGTRVGIIEATVDGLNISSDGNLSLEAALNANCTTGGDANFEVGGFTNFTSGRDATFDFAGMANFAIGTSAAFHVQHNFEFFAGSDANFEAGDNATFEAGQDAIFSAGQDLSFDAGRDANLNAGQDANLSSGLETRLQMRSAILDARNKIEVKASGDVTIKGSKVDINGTSF